MTNNYPQKTIAQSQEKAKDQIGEEFDEASDTKEQESSEASKPKKALSKREIMEQLSRERFPWDE